MSKVRVLQFSSRSSDDCGVGKYQEQFVSVLNEGDIVETEFFSSTPYRTRIMNSNEFKNFLRELHEALKGFDILHIQHEFGLYTHEEFREIAKVAKKSHKKVIVTVHTSPNFAFKFTRPGGVGLRSALHVVRQGRRHKAFRSNHIEPIGWSDKIIVHNKATKQSLVDYGISQEKVTLFTHPVPDTTNPETSSEISKNLNKNDDDIVYCTVGFLHRYKGISDAIKALKYLPANYKLAIIGGLHPTSDDVKFYNATTDLIDQLNLKDRVYITGFVKDDSRLNSLIRECDVCVYPYDRVYYASVSSGSLNLAFSNETPVVAYPTDSFKEMNTDNQIVLCQSFAYYELARELQRIDIERQKSLIREYAFKNAWSKLTQNLEQIYRSV